TRIVMTERRWLQHGAWATLLLAAWATLEAMRWSHGAGTGAVEASVPPLPPASEKDTLPLAPKGYVCSRARGPIRVDGRLDDEAWQAAPWTDAFVDIEGEIRPRPRFQTR